MTRWERFRARRPCIRDMVYFWGWSIVWLALTTLALFIFLSSLSSCRAEAQECLLGLTPDGIEPLPGVPTDVCVDCSCSATQPSLRPFTQRELDELSAWRPPPVVEEEDLPVPPPVAVRRSRPLPDLSTEDVTAALATFDSTIEWVCGPVHIFLEDHVARVAVGYSMCLPASESVPGAWVGRTTPEAREPVREAPAAPERPKRAWAIPRNVAPRPRGD